MGDVGALVQGLVGIPVAAAPGVEPRQYVAAFGRVAGQGQGGEGVQADAGGLQGLLAEYCPAYSSRNGRPTRYGLSRIGPVMNSAAAAAIFSGRRASCRSARGRTSSCQRPRGRLTQRQRHPADERTGGGTRPHPAPGLPHRHRAPRPRQPAPRHPAATKPSTRPTPVPLGAATPRPRPARQTCGQDGQRQPARGQPQPRRRRRPAGQHRLAVPCSRHPLWVPMGHAGQ